MPGDRGRNRSDSRRRWRPRVFRVTGVDLSPAMLGRLRAKGGAVVPVAVADARRLPFGAAAFDAVLACHVLHLVQAWADVADEALRVLRPGGTFLVSQGRAER